MKKKLAGYNLYKPAGNAAREWLWPPGGGFARPGLEEKSFGGLCRRALLAEDFFRPRISKSVRLLFIYGTSDLIRTTAHAREMVK